MLEPEIRVAPEACAAVELPGGFLLIGHGGANVIDTGIGQTPVVIDAEGVVLRSGTVFAWCRAGCCGQIPQRWSSVDAAADYHGSYIVDHDGTRLPMDRSALE